MIDYLALAGHDLSEAARILTDLVAHEGLKVSYSQQLALRADIRNAISGSAAMIAHHIDGSVVTVVTDDCNLTLSVDGDVIALVDIDVIEMGVTSGQS